jgi:hypothetical protein
MVDPKTEDGLYNAILLDTGDPELAERTLTEIKVQAKLRAMQSAGPLPNA